MLCERIRRHPGPDEFSIFTNPFIWWCVDNGDGKQIISMGFWDNVPHNMWFFAEFRFRGPKANDPEAVKQMRIRRITDQEELEKVATDYLAKIHKREKRIDNVDE
jgi:hypothetical protein